MKNLLIVLLLLAVFVLWAMLWTQKDASPQESLLPQETGWESNRESVGALKQYRLDSAGLTFAYPANFYLVKREVGSLSKPQTSIVLVLDTKENRDLLAGKIQEAREGPSNVSIDIYSNPQKLSPSTWAETETTWKLGSKKLSPIIISDLSGVSFDWSGLYAGKSAIITKGDKTYVFSVTWSSLDDPILSAFSKIISTAQISN